MPEGIDLTIWQDESQDLVDRLDALVKNARSGLLLVLLLLVLLLPRLLPRLRQLLNPLRQKQKSMKVLLRPDSRKEVNVIK